MECPCDYTFLDPLYYTYYTIYTLHIIHINILYIPLHYCLGHDLIETVCQDQGRSLSSLPGLNEVLADQGGSCSSPLGCQGVPGPRPRMRDRGRLRGRFTATGAKTMTDAPRFLLYSQGSIGWSLGND